VNSLSLYISDKIKMINDNLGKGIDNLDLESLEAVKVPLKQLRSHLRESLQGNLREPVQELVKKLKRNETLTGEDLQTIEKWLVGDAEYYTEIENNFQDWISECKRLITVLSGYSSEGYAEDEISIFKLNAFLTDLEFTLSDVIRYVYSSNRIKRFKDSVSQGNINSEDKKALADLIKRQLDSPEF